MTRISLTVAKALATIEHEPTQSPTEVRQGGYLPNPFDNTNHTIGSNGGAGSLVASNEV